MVKITKVSVKNNYRLELTFDNGVCGVVDEKTGGGFSGTVPRIDLCLKLAIITHLIFMRSKAATLL